MRNLVGWVLTHRFAEKALVSIAAVLSLAAPAIAQNSLSLGSQTSTLPSNTRVDLGLDPSGNYGPIALDSNHYTMVNCALGCGGSGGGGSNNSVGTYGATLSSLTQIGVLDALGHSQPVGPNYPMPVAAPPQQTMLPPVSVAVPAGTSTTIWVTSTVARTLKIIPAGGNTSCLMDDSGNPASASSIPIPTGWVYDLADTPPKYNISVFCPTAGQVIVSQGN